MNVSETVERSWIEPLVIGHRGAAAYAPENTVASFEAAIAQGVAGVECDVHVSRDGEPMVIHDATLDRTTSLTGAVAQTDSATMRAAGVPTLGETLQVTKDRALSVIEIKDGKEVVRKVFELLRSENMVDQAVLFSFYSHHLREARRIDPSAFVVLLSSTALAIDWLAVDGIGVAYPAIDEAFATKARKRRLPLFAWTVPPGPEVDRLRSLGVNFLVTNHPREVRAQLGSPPCNNRDSG